MVRRIVVVMDDGEIRETLIHPHIDAWQLGARSICRSHQSAKGPRSEDAILWAAASY